MIKDGKFIIPEARIETTTLCNAKCIMCPRNKMKRNKGITMTLSFFKRLVDECKELGAKLIVMCGMGEPLCDRHIVERTKYLTEIGLKSFFTTNGSLMTEKMSSNLLKAGLNDVRFSIHAIDLDTYKKVHGIHNNSNVFHNLKTFIELRNKGDYKCNVHVSTIPMNGESIEDIRCLFEELYMVDFLEIWKPHNWTSKVNYRKVSMKKKITCGRPLNGPVEIVVDGSLRACCFDPDVQTGLGRSWNDSIKGVLEGSYFLKELQENHRTGNHEGELCENCDQLNTGENPLLYSNRDSKCKVGVTSTGKNLIGG